MSVSQKTQSRVRRKNRVRAKITGTVQRPRLSVYKSNTAIYAQLIDDVSGVTIAAASSLKEKKANIETAKKVGADLAAAAKKAKVETCVFDRNGYKYHGAVKELADAAREGGLQF